jgi:hypothetical protein
LTGSSVALARGVESELVLEVVVVVDEVELECEVVAVPLLASESVAVPEESSLDVSVESSSSSSEVIVVFECDVMVVVVDECELEVVEAEPLVEVLVEVLVEEFAEVVPEWLELESWLAPGVEPEFVESSAGLESSPHATKSAEPTTAKTSEMARKERREVRSRGVCITARFCHREAFAVEFKSKKKRR